MHLKANGVAHTLQVQPGQSARAGRPMVQSLTSVVTRMVLPATPGQVWNGLLFHEQVDKRPPLHLRLLHPVPLGTEGGKSRVGDKVKCLYDRGHLTMRITRVDAPRRYEFEVVEQKLKVGNGLALAGGGYTLRLHEGGTEVGVETRYVSVMRPGWLWRPIEAAACRMIHRHLLSAVRRKFKSASRASS
jgi:hypothetical protein